MCSLYSITQLAKSTSGKKSENTSSLSQGTELKPKPLSWQCTWARLMSTATRHQLEQRFSTFSDSRTTWQILSRFVDHQKNFYIFLEKIQNFWRPFKVIFPKFVLGSQTTKRNFANFLAFFRVKDRKNIPISICSLVVTQFMKRYQVLVRSFVRNQPERRWGQFLLFLFSHRNDTSL